MSASREADAVQSWRSLGETLRPVVGWLCALGGAVALGLGYLGVSREILVAKQLPYMISGGLGGFALVLVGGSLLGTQEVRRQARRLAELETLVGELHDVLLTEVEREPGSEERLLDSAG